MRHVLPGCLVMLLTSVATVAQEILVDVDVLVTDESGTPVEGATVTCLPFSKFTAIASLPTPEEEVNTNALGMAVFGPHPFPTKFVIHAAHQNRTTVHVLEMQFKGTYEAKDTLVLKPSQRFMRGTVTDVASQPLPGVRLVGWSALHLAETDAEGRFEFGLPQGSPLAATYVYRPDHAIMWWNTNSVGSESLIVLPEGKAVCGHVMMHDDTPAEGVRVGYRLSFTYTDSNGDFETMPIATKNGSITVSTAQELEVGRLSAQAKLQEIPDAPVELRFKEAPVVYRRRELHLIKPYYMDVFDNYMDVITVEDPTGDPYAMLVKGRAVHAETGEGVRGTIHFTTLPDESASEYPPSAESDEDGIFAVHVIEKNTDI